MKVRVVLFAFCAVVFASAPAFAETITTILDLFGSNNQYAGFYNYSAGPGHYVGEHLSVEKVFVCEWCVGPGGTYFHSIDVPASVGGQATFWLLTRQGIPAEDYIAAILTSTQTSPTTDARGNEIFTYYPDRNIGADILGSTLMLVSGRNWLGSPLAGISDETLHYVLFSPFDSQPHPQWFSTGLELIPAVRLNASDSAIVPEPSTWLLLASGLVGITLVRRWRYS
jgi:hypothetical protein